MTEFDLIREIIPGLASNDQVVVGAGDDCAVLDMGDPLSLTLFKTDAVVQGVHFEVSTEAERVGHKALARCLSDIAAMAGTPIAALITLGLPLNFDPKYVLGIYTGINSLARRFGVAVVGGETTRNESGIIISVSLLGSIPRGRLLLRSHAKVGDAIFVTGKLGGSISGKHLDFEPRLTEARWLAEHFKIHALMDISDGLAGDLPHILRASLVGADLLSDAIPISREAQLRAKAESAAKPPLLAALTDGEDFELLFTLPSRLAVQLMDAWRVQFPELNLSCVGRVTSLPGLRLKSKMGSKPMPQHGYDHFAQPE